MYLKNLKTKFTGKNLIYHKSIDSTQKEAWRLVGEEIPNGSLIVADLQTNGIGTHGRKWITDEEGNVAFSIVLYPNCNIKKLNNLTQNIARDIVKVFKNLYGIELGIKHPNDIVFDGKKLGGILTETKLLGERVKNLIIGIGLNLNQERFNENIKGVATSIKNEFGICVDRDEVIAEVCNALEYLFVFDN